jgi:L-rhamnose-H+ transport protein
MQAVLGIIFHTIGGFSSGSFYMSFNKVKKWRWEIFWITGGDFLWLIASYLAAWLTIPGFIEIIGSADKNIAYFTFLMGLLWGIGGLTYRLGIRYLGISHGNYVILGLYAAFGALVPFVYYNMFPEDGKISFTDMIESSGGRLIINGVFVCLAGIAICGKPE